MSYNLNNYDAKQFGVGPSKIYIGPYNPTAAGGTPSTTVGAVQDTASITPVRDVLSITQGIPAREVDAFVTAERLDLVFTGIQWNLPMLHRALGGGVLPATSGQTTTFNFGGDILMTDLSIQLEHRLPNGSTVLLNAWQARGNGTVPITMPPDNVHQHSYTFTLVEGLSDWTNSALAANAKMFQLLYVEAP